MTSTVTISAAEPRAALDSAERYRGETEPVDPRAGRVPGAVGAPTGDNRDAAGGFLPAVAGVDAALHPGSWSAWSADPERPAATGPHPG
ncbi:hypothetical protein [Streptomyces hainanensis]|uniref:hypothetical protein n=1 Tax=Streptomyces hainanensis TaxID=402648 RepID=UPI001A9E0661